MQHLLIPILLALSLTQTGVPTSANRPMMLQGVHKIVCLGDAITAFADQERGYAWLLQHYLSALYGESNSGGIEVISDGSTAACSDDILRHIDLDVLIKKPDMVTLSCGLNDIILGFDADSPQGGGPRGVRLPEYKSNMQSIIQKLQKAHIKIVILSLTVIEEGPANHQTAKLQNTKIAAYNAALHDLAVKYKVPYVDLAKPFLEMIAHAHPTSDHKPLLTDGSNLTPLGSKMVARALLTALGITQADLSSAEKQDPKLGNPDSSESTP